MSDKVELDKNEPRKFHEKVYEVRESLLTVLQKINHIRTMRHLIIAVLLILCMDIIVYDLTTYGRVIRKKFLGSKISFFFLQIFC